MQITPNLIFIVALVVLPCSRAYSEHVLLDGLRHVRIEGPREWTEFPDSPDERYIDVKFKSSENKSEATLVVQQQDVKQRWNVEINGKQLGRLRINENDMLVYFPVPANVLRQGKNALRIEQANQRDAVPDDVRIGNFRLLDRRVKDVLSDATCELTVVEAVTGKSLPSRITILNSDGALQSVGASSGDNLAVRPVSSTRPTVPHDLASPTNTTVSLHLVHSCTTPLLEKTSKAGISDLMRWRLLTRRGANRHLATVSRLDGSPQSRLPCHSRR